MTDLPKVTVLLAVRDGARHLGAQLGSIAAQEGVDWRVLAGLDPSQDESRRVLDGFEIDHPGRMRVTDGPGRGAAANFLMLLGLTMPDDGFLAFSDQDDVWFPDKLSRAVRAMASQAGPALWSSQTMLTDEGLHPLGPSQAMPFDPGFGLVLVEALASGNSMVLNAEAATLLRKAALMTAPDLLEGIHHDWWATQVVAGAGGRLIWDARPSLFYRQHAAALLGHGGGVRRLGRVAGGGYLVALRAQVKAISAAQSLFIPENTRLLRQMEEVLSGKNRLRALRLPVQRRTWPATLALRVLLMLRG